MKPLVSILIPAYNAEETIADRSNPRLPNLATQGDHRGERRIHRIVRPKWRGALARKGHSCVHWRTRALSAAITMPSGSARETTSNGWMRMISLRRTRSSGNLRRCGR